MDRAAGRSPREDSSEVPAGKVAVPNPVANLTIITSTAPISFPSKRDPAPEPPVAGGAVKNPVVNPTIIPATVPISFPSAHDPAPELLRLRVVVPKC